MNELIAVIQHFEGCKLSKTHQRLHLGVWFSPMRDAPNTEGLRHRRMDGILGIFLLIRTLTIGQGSGRRQKVNDRQKTSSK